MLFLLTLILLPLVALPGAAKIAKLLRRRTRRLSLDCHREKKRRQLAEAKHEFVAQLEPMSEAELQSIKGCGSAPQLIERMRAGRLKPDRLLLAYRRAAIAVDRRCNCVVEYLEPTGHEHGHADGPLSGLPVSLKEDLRVCGHDSCAGCAALIDHPAEADCGPVTLLKVLGAVPFARTIVPQSEMSVLSSNPIDGTVQHPTHPGRCPGGSSSGEAALVAAGGSPLGFGTDLGGSVRLPAAWCGCVGFKPTHGRLVGLGFTPAVSGQCLLPPTWGPLSPDVATIRLVMAAMCEAGSQQYEMQAEVPPMGWNAAEAKGGAEQHKLRVGYFIDGGIFDVLPCMRRAVDEVRRGLEARGHILVPWDPPPAPYLELFMRAVFSDGGCRLLRLMEGDEESAAVRYKLATLRSPSWLRRLQAKQAVSTGRMSAALWLSSSLGLASVDSLWSLTEKLEETRQRFYAAWHEARLDALICPAGATPAVHLSPSGSFTGALVHFNMFNTLNCPAGTVPTTRVSLADVAEAAAGGYSASKSGWHRTVLAMHGDDAVGLPVGVQCAALPWRDELCVRLMAEVEAAVSSDMDS